MNAVMAVVCLLCFLYYAFTGDKAEAMLFVTWGYIFMAHARIDTHHGDRDDEA